MYGYGFGWAGHDSHYGGSWAGGWAPSWSYYPRGGFESLGGHERGYYGQSYYGWHDAARRSRIGGELAHSRVASERGIRASIHRDAYLDRFLWRW
jgi:hypothetical protein